MDSDTEIVCATCKQWGQVYDLDPRGFLIVHPGRLFPCRVPLNPPADAG